MKILVCISVTPDTTSKISFKNNDSEYNGDGVQYILNPYDEWYALVRALEIKEQTGGTVTVIHVGPSTNEAMIRKALAIGADDAVRINLAPINALVTASLIGDYAKDKNYDLILTGKETIDYQTATVGPMIAEILGLPFISFVSRLELEGNLAKCNRDIEGGIELVSVHLPAVISASKGMAEQRIPNMKGIMTAKTKPLQIIEPGMTLDPRTETVQYTLPPAKKGVVMFTADQLDQLVKTLHAKEKLF